MRTAFVCTILAAFALLPMAVLAEPTITIYTDADTYQSGDTIEVSLSAENHGEGMSVDVYVGLLTPDGGLYTLSPYGQHGWSGSVEAWIPGIYVPSPFTMSRTPLFWFDLPCYMPPISDEGEYNFAVVLTCAGTMQWISDLSLAPFTVGASAASHYYVDGEAGNDSNDGSEGSPWKTITHALASALSTPATIHVAAGTYSSSTNGETFPLDMKSYVSLQGEGSESTILDAQQAAYHVIYCSYVSHLSIEQLTIAGGEAKGAEHTDKRGGGIYCSDSSPTISNNRITANTAISGGGIGCWGGWPTISGNTISGNSADSNAGGIYCDHSSPMISNNTISKNTADWAGGIYCSESSPTIACNAITANTAGGLGGAIHCWESSPTIENNTISGNRAQHGSGIYCWHGWPTISGNTISGNSADSNAGGIYCDHSSPMISNNTITRNSSLGVYGYNGYGGGILCNYSSPTIVNNIIQANTAISGGGIFYWSSTPAIVNNAILDNSAGRGGGISCWGGSATIVNNIIKANAADRGGGMYCSGSPTIIDCIIWGNGDDLSSCSGTYCCIEDDDAGEGNIHDDPMFVEGPLGEYYLDPDSPCIDAGSRPAEDAGLSDRTTQTDGTPDSGMVDMGYHYPLP
ncbi:MAG TPA: right-handed parallel beta-helix repeat-containing protein [bacterium]|nr:right-handed parallel beta-helix repeat-containing protein [bacterium]